MIKSELVRRLGIALPHFYERELSLAVRLVLGEMTDALARGQRVELRGFGSFQTKQRAARMGRNPRTGEAVAIAARRKVYFRTGKDLQARINVPKPDEPKEPASNKGTRGEAIRNKS